MESTLDRIKQLETDMYFGDGKENPPITTRLARLEDAIEDLKTIKWLLIGTIITVISNLVFTHLKLF